MHAQPRLWPSVTLGHTLLQRLKTATTAATSFCSDDNDQSGIDGDASGDNDHGSVDGDPFDDDNNSSNLPTALIPNFCEIHAISYESKTTNTQEHNILPWFG